MKRVNQPRMFFVPFLRFAAPSPAAAANVLLRLEMGGRGQVENPMLVLVFDKERLFGSQE